MTEKRRGKPKLEINKNEFQAVINQLESQQKFDNLSALWVAVENSGWAKSLLPRPLTASVAMARARDLGIITITQPGKRGNFSNGTKRGARGPRKLKMAAFGDSIAAMKRTSPKFALPIIEKLERGSKVAAIKLNCLQCCNWQKIEIRECEIKYCAMYPFRPYQTNQDTDTTDNTTENNSSE